MWRWRRTKGLPVMREEERYRAVEACKWVDQVVRDAPYITTLEMMDAYDCDICVHGDDLVTAADGTDTYAAVKAAWQIQGSEKDGERLHHRTRWQDALDDS